MTRHRLQGLYAITSTDQQEIDTLCQTGEAALRGGAKIIQYRDKSKDQAQRRECAERLLQLAQQHGACLLINDDVELAKTVGAHGVHLGQGDMPIGEARRILGTDAIIGITCHDQLTLAREAQAAGADYVAFGRFFASRTKPEAGTAPLALIRQAKRELTIPVAAIGGITLANAAQLIQQGADMLALVEGLFGQADISATAQDFLRLFVEAPLVEKPLVGGNSHENIAL